MHVDTNLYEKLVELRLDKDFGHKYSISFFALVLNTGNKRIYYVYMKKHRPVMFDFKMALQFAFLTPVGVYSVCNLVPSEQWLTNYISSPFQNSS